jgi:hypothetical protein
MRIKTKTSADVVGLNIKRNQKHDGKEAHLDIEVGVKQENAKKFGADFGDLAFSSMRERTEESETKIVHLQDNIKPGSRVVYERHEILIDDNKLNEQPELLSIRTVDGEARVIAKYRVPVATTQKGLLTKLMGKVGGVVTVEFNPEQQLMDLKQKPEKAVQS